MSWFHDTDFDFRDERPRTAVADGVLLERRAVLRLSGAALLAALALPACGSPKTRSAFGAVEAPPPDELLSLGEMLAIANPMAQKLVDNGLSQEDVYLREVSKLVAQLGEPSRQEMRTAQTAAGERRRSWNESTGYFIVFVQYELAAGRGFGHHDHRNYNGVIRGIAGEARIRNFEIVGDEMVPPEGSTFQLRKTRDELVRPGDISTLGTRKDNVHDLVAGAQGAKVYDAFTMFAPDARSYAMDVAEESRDSEGLVFDAAWS